MGVPFFDLTRQYAALEAHIRPAVDEVLRTQRCIGGPRVTELEQALARQVGVAHAVGVSSGTDALLLSLMALNLKPGDEVVTSPFTFFAPVGSIMRLGGRPVFVDIEPEGFNLDAAHVEDALGAKTRAVLPVHLFGQCAPMDQVMEAVQNAPGVAVIEDLAQALGASIEGRQAGSFGLAGCVSFFPTKNLGAAGDGGMVFTDDDAFHERLRLLARHGASPKYHHVEVGGNFRLDALQAAILSAKLPHLHSFCERRRAHAAYYNEALADLEGLELPRHAPGHRPVYNQYVVRVADRARLIAHLEKRGIGHGIYYPEPLHTQPALRELGYQRGDFPRAEQACEQVLALPVFPELRDDEREAVADAVREALHQKAPAL
ncbi:DegT/DnrJ/EryC1/StrS family aminotransferase [Lujinxingia vulgaris]|uniref:DegT/DnrJ/EryC1/StrS family aminotransferase n=1 Tax=Lujinxingia vulgaris TaxID=2600176 RepID=A0A5C6XN48_9DELT|nr:DegT/DnrJ/EryC1/StrS family aminotransferase [Lujinxingia vulgaris]TXD42821.1 DegT/DnrJ/EryC1/StrS family aminotransferase [Lujinxingia vulgaris]